jgi:hypothetical protein
MQQTAERHAFFAACPSIDACPQAPKPRYFSSRAALNRFLRSEIRPVSAAKEAEFTGIGVNAILRLRAERQAARAKAREKVLKEIRDGERSPWSFPPNLIRITHKVQGWRDTPVKHCSEHPNSKSNYSLTEFLPLAVMTPVIEFSLEEQFHRAEQGICNLFTCCLGEHWRFGDIQADVFDQWHNPALPRREFANVGEIVIDFVYDIDTSFRKFHPNATNEAAANLWSSWDLQDLITRFCARLAKSERAEKLTGNAFAVQMEVRRARSFVFERLASLSRSLLEQSTSVGKKTAELAEVPEVTSADEADLKAKVDAFLLKCNQEPDLGITLRRKHIHLAVGHKTPRQFQLWQSGNTKATQQDNQNFTRILHMRPADFVALLRRRNIIQ